MHITKRQYTLFFGSVILYQVLHEVVYGLLGFSFFLGTFIWEFFFSGCLVLLAFLINRKLRVMIEQRYAWSDNPLQRLVVQSIAFTGVSGLLVTLFRVLAAYIQFVILENVFLSIRSLVIDFCILAVVIELKVLLEFGQYLLGKWNSARIEMADFQKEKAQFSLELLRTQINPHFLFNNLNTLSSLIYTDQDKAAAFLRKLSGVYRSILEYRNKEIITLEEELLFFHDYRELLEIRFENMLFFRVHIDPELYPRCIIPLTLQMLVENAIKHNVLSQKMPLTITIESRGEFIYVENNYQPKEVLEYSSGLGLKMIANRFAYLTRQPVEIIPGAQTFLVKIPLIPTE
jgi:two-component system LytT family sensor kinase